MKYKMAALLGAFFCLLCLFGSVQTVCAEERDFEIFVPTDPGETPREMPHVEYYQAGSDTVVYAGPGTDRRRLGTLRMGQPAIATGITEKGWKQICFVGMVGYVPGDSLVAYRLPTQIQSDPIVVEEGMMINILGDSITYGDSLPDVTQAYSYLIAAMLGNNVTCNNYGWRGSCVGGEDNVGRFIDRYLSMKRGADVVLVFGGTNDYAGRNEIGVPLGNMGDATGDSFYGALNLLMCGLKQMYPDGRIIFLTPLKRADDMHRNLSGYDLSQYVTAIREMAAIYGIQVVDLYNEPELDFTLRGKNCLLDGLHPNATGHYLLGTYICDHLFSGEILSQMPDDEYLGKSDSDI